MRSHRFLLIIACFLTLSACRCFDVPVKRRQNDAGQKITGALESPTMISLVSEGCEIYEQQLHCLDKAVQEEDLKLLNEQELIGLAFYQFDLCALDIYGKVHCEKSKHTAKLIELTASFRFDSIKSYVGIFCGHDVDSDLVHCFSADSTNPDFDKLAGGVKAKDYSTAHLNACIINDKDEIECWPTFIARRMEAPAGKYDRVISAGSTVCGQKGDRVKCRTTDLTTYSDPLFQPHISTIESMSWKKIALGPVLLCGIDEHDKARCFGTDRLIKLTLPPSPIVDITVGSFDVCIRKTPQSHMECLRKK